jgi:regulator of replication initiation timing
MYFYIPEVPDLNFPEYSCNIVDRVTRALDSIVKEPRTIRELVDYAEDSVSMSIGEIEYLRTINSQLREIAHEYREFAEEMYVLATTILKEANKTEKELQDKIDQLEQQIYGLTCEIGELQDKMSNDLFSQENKN